MSNICLSILLRNPGPGTSITTLKKWIFIHTFPSLSLSTVHQTAIHVATTEYFSCSHTLYLEINFKLNKFYATLYFQKHLILIGSQAAIKTLITVVCAVLKLNTILFNKNLWSLRNISFSVLERHVCPIQMLSAKSSYQLYQNQKHVI